MSVRDDSRPLSGDETTATMTLSEVIADYDKRNIGIIHGKRYTWVHGYGVTERSTYLGSTGPRLVFLKDCYGDEIPGTLAVRDATVQAVVAE